MTIPLGLYGAAQPVASGGFTLTFHGFSDTLTGRSIGAASASRTVIGVYSAETFNAGSTASATINGSAATVAHTGVVNSPSVYMPLNVFFHAIVPSGTTADFAVSLGQVTRRPGLALWTIDRVVSASSIDSSTGTEPPPVTVTVPSGGLVLAALATQQDFDPNSTTWSNLTEDYDALGDRYLGSGGHATPPAGGHTVSVSRGSTSRQARLDAVAFTVT